MVSLCDGHGTPSYLSMMTRYRVTSWMRGFAWLPLLGAVTVVLIPFRADVGQEHVVLTFLLVVLGASASGGRVVGLTLAFVGFLLIDYYFQPPYDTFAVGKGLDWIVLLAFLATALVATQLLARARAQTELAEERSLEIDRFASLGAESLNVGRAEEALRTIANVIRETVRVKWCEIIIHDESGEAPRVAASSSAAIAAGLPAHSLDIPLEVRGQEVGTLRLGHDVHIIFDDTQRRSLSALSYYAALAVERERLSGQVEHTQALREANQLKDALLAAVSHDLRTPLTTIKALARRISARGDEDAAIIEQQADRLDRLVADLLDLSRLNSAAFPLLAEIGVAEDLAGAALREADFLLGPGRVVPVIDRDRPLLLGRFDFAQSLRVLSNLIENAGKYSPKDATIELRVARDDRDVTFAVADRGPGVPATDQERIFEAFYRGARASPDAGGAGLGLAIGKRLAAAQGGSLTYADREGGGSIFTFRVPAVDGLDGDG